MEPNAITAIRSEARSSIEIQRAKDGTYYWTLKRYYDAQEPHAYIDAIEEVQAVDQQLRSLFAAQAGEESPDKLPF